MLRPLIAALCLLAAPVAAQIAPSPAEIAAYTGLHRAAHENDLPALRRLLASGADPNARDSRQRTPAHVAAFASSDAALTALAA